MRKSQAACSGTRLDERYASREFLDVRVLLLLLVLRALVVPITAVAQCPDGSPAPCARPTAAARYSVAVLPFENRARDTSLTLLAEGLADQITTDLGTVQRLDIKPPASVRFVLSRTPREPARLARTLGSRWLVDGQLLSSGTSVHVNVQLIDAANDRVRWTGTFQRPGDDPFAVISTVADSVATAIIGALAPEDRARFTRRPTTDNSALAAYTRGMGALHHFDEADLRYAVAQFERAATADTTFAEAWAGLAEALIWMDVYTAPSEVYPRARDAAQRALALDSTSSPALGVLASIAVGYDWDPIRGEALARRALQRDSGYGRAWVYLADALVSQGRRAAAADAYARAVAADTLDEEVATEATFGLQVARQTDAALALVRRWRQLQPDDMAWDRIEASILVSAKRCATSPPRTPRSAIALACAGRVAAARAATDTLVAQFESGRHVPAIYLAVTFVSLGDKEAALRWFTRAVDERAYSMVDARENPIWDSLRDDPRFAAQLERIQPAR